MTTPRSVDDATYFIRGITFKPRELVDPDDTDAVVCMRTKNVQKDLDETDLIAVPKRLVRKPELYLQPGDTLISSANSWKLVGKCSYVGTLSYPATAGGFISIVRPKPKTHPRFLFHWLSSPRTQHVIRNLGRQTTNISNLDVSRFKKLNFPEIDYDEQRRIARILDKADAIRRKRKCKLALANDILKSAFLERFGNPASNPRNLPVKPIKKMGVVITGNTPPRKEPENFGPGIEWIKSDNIRARRHIVTVAKETLSEKGRMVARIVPAGATLVTCIAGSPKSIGNAALSDREVAFNQQINAVVPGPDVDPYFLYCQFCIAKQLIQGASTNSMKGMVSKGKFQEIEFICPPKHEQQEFGLFFHRMTTIIQKLNAASDSSEALVNSLSQRALRGEL